MEEKWAVREPGQEGEFGGLSFDGMGMGDAGGGVAIGMGGNEGGVPVCKHLLAALLGERIAVLGRYVKERRVGRGEMVGILGEG